MSTTVTYKGQTLTTVENQTKTLNTAGTWVEGDFTLTDVTQGGVVPTGFVEEYAYTVESAITASNNSIAVMNEVCPATLDESDRNCYLFFVTNNTASTKRALFGLWQRTGTGDNSRVVCACRGQSATDIRWINSGTFDWWFSAGSVIHVLKFNSLLGAE